MDAYAMPEGFDWEQAALGAYANVNKRDNRANPVAAPYDQPACTPRTTVTTRHPAMSYTNVRVHRSLMRLIEAQKLEWQTTTGIINDLLHEALDKRGTLDLERPEGAFTYLGFKEEEKEEEEANRDLNARAREKKEVPLELSQYEDLIHEFWRVKKGSKGLTAWKLLMTELGKFHAKYPSEVADQITMAINGKWTGISLARHEQYKAPRNGYKATEQEFKHPASRVFRNGRFEDDHGPTTNPMLRDLI